MHPSAPDFLRQFHDASTDVQRLLLTGAVQDFLARHGREQTLELLLASLYPVRGGGTESQSRTLAALARLPKDAAIALLTPVDPASLRAEDCLSDDEVQTVLTGKSR